MCGPPGTNCWTNPDGTEECRTDDGCCGALCGTCDELCHDYTGRRYGNGPFGRWGTYKANADFDAKPVMKEDQMWKEWAMGQMQDEANRPVMGDFMDAFNYARGEVIAHQAKSMGPAFRMLERANEKMGVPADCDADGFAKCLVDTHFERGPCRPVTDTWSWTDKETGEVHEETNNWEECPDSPYATECAKTFGCEPAVIIGTHDEREFGEKDEVMRNNAYEIERSDQHMAEHVGKRMQEAFGKN